MWLCSRPSSQLSPVNTVNRKDTASRMAPWTATGTPSMSALDVCTQRVCLICWVPHQSPKAGGVGPSPWALAMLAWGRGGSGLRKSRPSNLLLRSSRCWEEPRARGGRLDVHAELFVCVGASRRGCQLFFYAGASRLWCAMGVRHTPIPYTTRGDRYQCLEQMRHNCDYNSQTSYYNYYTEQTLLFKSVLSIIVARYKCLEQVRHYCNYYTEQTLLYKSFHML